MRRIVVGYSGGVTSAWCLGWALRTYPRGEVVALFHDTKSEDADTYRYLREMAVVLGIPITERSDGRSVEEVEDDDDFDGFTTCDGDCNDKNSLVNPCAFDTNLASGDPVGKDGIDNDCDGLVDCADPDWVVPPHPPAVLTDPAAAAPEPVPPADRACDRARHGATGLGRRLPRRSHRRHQEALRRHARVA